MFGKSSQSKKKEDDNSGVQKKSSRGNMDEYEALRTIVSENPGLMSRVLDKIRMLRTPIPAAKAAEVKQGEEKKGDEKK